MLWVSDPKASNHQKLRVQLPITLLKEKRKAQEISFCYWSKYLYQKVNSLSSLPKLFVHYRFPHDFKMCPLSIDFYTLVRNTLVRNVLFPSPTDVRSRNPLTLWTNVQLLDVWL